MTYRRAAGAGRILPAGNLSREHAEQLVGAAVLAPSVLNTQPWLFDARADAVDVHLDAARTLPVLDPTGRAAVISCAAAVLNLRLAVQAAGREAAVQLLPVPDDPAHLAQVRIAGPAEVTATHRALYEAIPHRHTNRYPFRDERLPVEVVAHLEEAAEAEGGLLRVLTTGEVPDVVRTVREADSVQRADHELRGEVGRWTNRDPNDHDGLTT